MFPLPYFQSHLTYKCNIKSVIGELDGLITALTNVFILSHAHAELLFF